MASHPIGITNPVVERMAAGDVALGMIVRLARSGEIARVARSTGHDFIFIDTQHAIFSLESIGHMAQAALGCGVAPLVRVGSCDDPNTSRLLDSGVTGIVFPDINTPAQAQRAVNAAKFAPIGKRSVSAGYPIYDYQTVPLTESVPFMNANTLVVCMIETLEGLANVEAIAAVPGVDVLHVGCNDMLVSMGKPGAFGDPEIMAAMDRILAAAKAQGIQVGFGGDRDLGRQVELIRKGVRFVTTQADIAMLMIEASRRTDSIRAALTRNELTTGTRGAQGFV